MKKLLIALILFLSITLTGCHEEETLPIDEIPYRLYDFDGVYYYDYVDYTHVEFRDYGFLFIAGIFNVDGTPTLLAYGFDHENDRFWRLGELECSDCTTIQLGHLDRSIPLIFITINNEIKSDYLFYVGGMGSLNYNDFKFLDNIENDLSDRELDPTDEEYWLDQVRNKPKSDYDIVIINGQIHINPKILVTLP